MIVFIIPPNETDITIIYNNYIILCMNIIKNYRTAGIIFKLVYNYKLYKN